MFHLKIKKTALLLHIPGSVFLIQYTQHRFAPARLVRDAETELAPSITNLINKSITDATVPALWKVARLSHLYKAGDKLLVENYRPISVLPVLSKVLERVIHTQMSAYLDHLGWLYKHQYGFRCGRSTAQAVGQLETLCLMPWMDEKSLVCYFSKYPRHSTL